MNFKTYKTLKIGDIVAPNRGKNKGKKCIVKNIWDVTDSDGYREILISANFLDRSLRTKPEGRDDLSDIFVSYKSLMKIEVKPIRIMIKDGFISCCSQLCTDECPNYNTCIVINTTTKKFLQMMLNSYYGKNGGNVISSTDEIDKIMQLKTDLK